MKTYLKKLHVRLIVCYRILFRKYDHWLIINLTDQELKKLLSGEEFDTNSIYHGQRPYNVDILLKNAAANISDIDLICDRAAFDAEYELFKAKRK